MFSLVFQGNYVAQWDADKVKIHVGNELPELVLAKANAINISNVGPLCFLCYIYYYITLSTADVWPKTLSEALVINNISSTVLVIISNVLALFLSCVSIYFFRKHTNPNWRGCTRRAMT